MKAWDRFRSELGWPGGMGILLLAVGWLFYVAVLQPLESRAGQVRELVDLRNDGEGGAAAQMSKFYDFFETGRPATEDLATIYRLAKENGLELQRGDYKALETKGSRLTSYQVSLPVHGGYVQIRSFAAQVLASIPVVSLDEIRFQRHDGTDSGVDANVRFTLFLLRP